MKKIMKYFWLISPPAKLAVAMLVLPLLFLTLLVPLAADDIDDDPTLA